MEPNETTSIVLRSLANGFHPGITSIIANYLEEAAGLCLEEQGHCSGVALVVKGIENNGFVLEWEPGDPKKGPCWDRDQATECGASGIAILLIYHLTSWRVIERAQKGDRVDYWLGEIDDDDPPFLKKKGRLEVSGIRKGYEYRVRSRAKEKLNRLSLSSGLLPTFVVIIEFGTPMSHVEHL